MAAPDAASALYGGEGKGALPRSPGGGPALLALPPPDAARGHAPLSRGLASRRSARDFVATSALTLAEVTELLWAAQGVTQPPEAPTAAPKGRTAPSAGALFPLELFLIAGENTIEVRASPRAAVARSKSRNRDLRPASQHCLYITHRRA